VRLFLDANVLFSAALGMRTRARALLDLAHARNVGLVTSALAIEEAGRNLASKAPHAAGELPRVTANIARSRVPDAGLIAWATTQGLPPKDAPILGAAVAARADLLVTGDRRHFGHLFGRTLEGLTVVSLGEALRLVLAVEPADQEQPQRDTL
jgi:uncharacterized protein